LPAEATAGSKVAHEGFEEKRRREKVVARSMEEGE
jgi:hypothetical protein